MARKKTLKAKTVVEERAKLYLVAYSAGDKVEREEFRATRIDTDHESLKAYLEKELIGEFRDWVYYVRLDDCVDDDAICNPILPKNFGKLDTDDL